MAHEALVERDPETTLLSALLDAARRDGAGGATVLEGPAGIGKTALLGWAGAEATRLGFRILTSRSRPISREASFGLLRDWFDLLARRAPEGEAPFDGPAAVLRRLADAPPVTETGFGLRWAVDGLSRERPVLLVADDLHWTDEASLQALELLLGALGGAPVVLLAAVRTGEQPAGGDVLDRIVAESRRLVLGPLTVDGVAAVLADGAAPSGLEASDLHRATGGVPFLLREVLRTGPGVPRTVVESVAARLDRLAGDVEETARAACVLQGAATPALVSDLSGIDRARTADHLQALAGAEILTVADGVATPVHPLVGDAVLATLTTSQRSALHLAAAGILSRDEHRRADVTVHLLQTLPGDDLDVRERLHAAGRAGLASGAAETAARYLVRACEEAAGVPLPVDLLEHTAQALAMSGDLERAVGLYERAAERTDDVAERALLRAALCDALVVGGRHEEAVRRYQDALADLTATEHHPLWQRLTARMLLSGLLISPGIAEDARADVVRILGRPESADTHEDRVMLGAAAAGECFSNGDWRLARGLAVRSIGGGRLLEEETADGAAYYMPTAALNWTDAVDEDVEALSRAVEDAQRRGSAMAFGTATACRGGVLCRAGRFTAALADSAFTESARALGWRAYLPMHVAQTMVALVRTGRLTEARALRPDLVQQTSHPVPALSTYASWGLAELDLAEGRYADALDLATRIAAQAPGNLAEINWRGMEVSALAGLGRAGEAAAAVTTYVEQARAWGVPSSVAAALLHQARHGDGDPVAPLEEALGLVERASLPYLHAQVAVDLAEHLLEGDPARALTLLRDAETYALDEAVLPLRDRTTPLLYALGAVPGTTDALVARLTPSELAVARLVAEGLSNREIGERLFVTRKTVEFHLSRVYRKLGTSSRQQLAAALRGPG